MLGLLPDKRATRVENNDRTYAGTTVKHPISVHVQALS